MTRYGTWLQVMDIRECYQTPWVRWGARLRAAFASWKLPAQFPEPSTTSPQPSITFSDTNQVALAGSTAQDANQAVPALVPGGVSATLIYKADDEQQRRLREVSLGPYSH